MNLIKKLSTVLGISKSYSSDIRTQAPEKVVAEIKKDRSFANRLMRQRLRAYASERQISDWRRAVEHALTPPYFDRIDLLYMYERAIDDGEVFTAMDTRCKKATSEKFHILTANEPNEEKTKLLEKSWFLDLLKAIVETDFYGTRVVQPESTTMKNGEFTELFVFPPEHVSPERGAILPDPSNPNFTIPYREEPFNNWLLEFGKKSDLGTLKKVVYYQIWKSFSEKDWRQHSARFGGPIPVIKTATTDENELNDMAANAENMSSNGYLILDDMDDATLLSDNRNNPQGMYTSAQDYCDKMIAKILAGQQSTSSEKAFVGSAEVHERILETYNDADLRKIQAAVNEKVLPFLIDKGYPFTKDDVFKFDYFYQLEKYKAEAQVAKQVAKEAATEKKAEEQTMSLLLKHVPFQKGCCNH